MYEVLATHIERNIAITLTLYRIETINHEGKGGVILEQSLEDARAYVEAIQATEDKWAKEAGRDPAQVFTKATVYVNKQRMQAIQTGTEQYNQGFVAELV